MTGRSVPEWVGATPDSRPPDRVILRLFTAQNGRCATCTRKIGVGGEEYDADHRVALANGGENRESNLSLVCRKTCHREKTAQDVAEKSAVYRKRKKHVAGRKKRSSFATSRDGKWKQRVDRTVERRDHD